MNIITKYLFSMPVMAVLLVLFALSCGVATFIENDFGSETAWAVVYTASWFELIQVILGANLLYNILVFKLYKKEKLPALVFHVSFLFILVGSGLTRYMGYEGSLHIREGESANIVKSTEPFIQAKAYKEGMVYGVNYKKLISKLGGNDFSFSINVKDKRANFEFKEYIPNAVESVVDDANGVPLISLVVSRSEAQNLLLKEGDEIENEGVVFSFNKKSEDETKPFVRFILQDGEFSFISNQDLSWFQMGANEYGEYPQREKHHFDGKRLYRIGDVNFAPKYVGLKGKEKLVRSEDVSAQNLYDALIINVTYNDISQDVVLMGKGKGYQGLPVVANIDNTTFVLKWGSSEISLPFDIKLADFQLERYPGSNSPSSYASEIVVIDKNASVELPYRIYMNHVLDYKGYRFFQASYDQDEGGTVLSVNKDPGKIPTYIGYILLSFGLLFNLFNPKSRFRKLAADIHQNITSEGKTKAKKTAKRLSGLLLFAASLWLLNPSALNAADNASGAKKHAELFGTILAQSMDGRIYPVDTIAHEILNKVHRSDTYEGLEAEEVLFAMLNEPEVWQDKPLIYVSHQELRKLIGIAGSYAAYSDFFDSRSEEYKLKQVVEIAERKKEAEKNQFDKDVIKVDERLNILFSTFSWDALRIIPKINDENHRWFPVSAALKMFPLDEAEELRTLLGIYFDSVAKASESGDWTSADKVVEAIKGYQRKYSAEIIPSSTKIKAEIFFNKAKIFDRIYPIYLLSGFILLLFIFVKMATSKLNINIVIKTLFAVNLLTFIVHTAGLALRWYVAEHAPWSNSYESMVYIAWAIALSGLFFSRTSIMSMSLAYIVAGITLFTAHLSWLDPHITNLMPVLKSHWLTIHVSVITASYGFLGLCALLGFFTLVLYIYKGFGKNTAEVQRNITEATKINEMSMILGLSLLAVGNFLGGVWANESWGRYWGWDPKETWALISILVYATVVHFRFIPKLNNQFAFAIASTIAYFSIIMTYFGVNFYLSGMHSYASGDPVPMPMFIWVIVFVIAVVIAGASVVVAKKGDLKRL